MWVYAMLFFEKKKKDEGSGSHPIEHLYNFHFVHCLRVHIVWLWALRLDISMRKSTNYMYRRVCEFISHLFVGSTKLFRIVLLAYGLCYSNNASGMVCLSVCLTWYYYVQYLYILYNMYNLKPWSWSKIHLGIHPHTIYIWLIWCNILCLCV